MTSIAVLNHVALVVPQVEVPAQVLNSFGYPVEPPQEFPGEGTREIYVGDFDQERSLLLLMEPMKKGSYQKALEKRGPGLHHIAIDVADLHGFTHSLCGSGWLLLPGSLKSATEYKTVWLARPGFPALIEVQERTDMPARKSPFISQLELPEIESFKNLLPYLGVPEISSSSDKNTWLTIRGKRLSLSEVLGPKEDPTFR